jgi:hypothetical protein
MVLGKDILPLWSIILHSVWWVLTIVLSPITIEYLCISGQTLPVGETVSYFYTLGFQR